MKYLTLLLILVMPNIQAARLDVEINGKDCTIEEIAYQGQINVIVSRGTCQKLYDMCTRDFCKVTKVDSKIDILPKNIGAERFDYFRKATRQHAW